jgi:hypothetical protein
VVDFFFLFRFRAGLDQFEAHRFSTCLLVSI